MNILRETGSRLTTLLVSFLVTENTVNEEEQCGKVRRDNAECTARQVPAWKTRPALLVIHYLCKIHH